MQVRWRTRVVAVLFAAIAAQGCARDWNSLNLYTASERFVTVSLSPDGQALAASVEHTNNVILFDVRSGNVRQVLKGLEQGIFSREQMWANEIAFSPDGRLIACAGIDDGVAVWDVATGNRPYEIISPKSPWSVAFSNDGKLLAAGGWDKTAVIYDAATGRKSTTLPCNGWRVDSVAFSPDGRILATATDGNVELWSTAEGTRLERLPRANRAPSFVTFSPDGESLAVSGASDVTLCRLRGAGKTLYKAARPTITEAVAVTTAVTLFVAMGGRFEGPPERYEPVAFSPDGGKLAIVRPSRKGIGGGYEVRVIDLASDGVERSSSNLPQAWGVSFSRDFRFVALGGQQISLFDMATGRRLTPQERPSGAVP